MVDKLSKVLQDIQNNATGLYQYTNGDVEVVIEEDEHTFTTLTVGDLLGSSTCVFGKSEEHKVINFPDGKTLGEFLNDPFEFNEWFCNNIKIKK